MRADQCESIAASDGGANSPWPLARLVHRQGQEIGTADAAANGHAFHWIFFVEGSMGIASLVRRTTP